MKTKIKNRIEKNHPECRPEEREVTLRLRLRLRRREKILFSSFQSEETEETGAVGAAGGPASKIFYHQNFLSISAIKQKCRKK